MTMLHHIREEGEEEGESQPTLLPKEFKAYTDVFNEKGAASLLAYSKRAEHAIEKIGRAHV